MAKVIVIKRRGHGRGNFIRNIARGVTGGLFERSDAPATEAAVEEKEVEISEECAEVAVTFLEQAEDIIEDKVLDPNLTAEQRQVLSDVYRKLQDLIKTVKE